MSLQRTSSLSRLSSLQSYRSSFFQWDNSLRRSGNSQEVLEQSSLVSRVVSRIVTSQLFQPLITALIIMNSVFLALYDPTKPFNSTRNLWIEYTEIFFQAAFTIEAVLLILHLGCYGYFSITANRFDFFLVAIGYVQFIIPRVQFSAHRDPAVTAFRVLRAMRILRSLRLLKQLPGMTILMEIIRAAADQLISVLILALFVLVAFAVTGVRMFQKASDANNPGPVAVIGFQNFWQASSTIFVVFSREGWVEIMNWIAESFKYSELFFIALTAIASILVLNLVVTVLVINHVDPSANRKRPFGYALERELASMKHRAKERKRKHAKCDVEDVKMRLMVSHECHPARGFISDKEFQEWKSLFGIMYDDWKRTNGYLEQDSTKQDEDKDMDPVGQENQTMKVDKANTWVSIYLTLFCFLISLKVPSFLKPSLTLELVFSFAILLNTCVLATQYFLQPLPLYHFIYWTSVICGSIFVIESWLRILHNGGLRNMSLLPWQNLFDLLYVHVGLMLSAFRVLQTILTFKAFKLLSPIYLENEILKKLNQKEKFSGYIVSILEKLVQIKEHVFREAWVFSKRQYLLRASLRRIGPFLMVIFLFMHCFAVAGLHLFGGFPNSNTVYADSASLGYDSYLRAFVTTFQVFTGEGWNTVMYIAVDLNPNYAAITVIYFVVGISLGNFLLLKFVLAIFLDTYFTYSVEQEREKLEAQMDKQLDIIREKIEEKENVLKKSKRVGSRLVSLQSMAMSLDSGAFDSRRTGLKCWAKLRIQFILSTTNILERIHEYRVADVIGFVGVFVFCLNALAFNWKYANHLCLALFVFEFLIRVVTEERDRFLIFDALIIVLLISKIWITGIILDAATAIVALRLIRWSRSLRMICHALYRSAPSCFVVICYSFVILTAFATFSVDLLKGRFRQCVGPEEFILNKTCYNFTSEEDRASQYGNIQFCPAERNCYDPDGLIRWENPKPNNLTGFSFDSYGESMLGLFELSTLQLWNEAMLNATCVTHIGQAPKCGTSDYFALYFMLLVSICHLFLLQLFITNIIKVFTTRERKETGDECLTDNQILWVENQMKVILHRPRKKALRSGSCRSWCFRIVDSSTFDRIIMCLVILDTVIIASQHKGEPEWMEQMAIVSTYVFGGIYFVEALLKIYAYGYDYFRSFRNVFDFIIVLFALVEILATAFEFGAPKLTSLRILRLAGAIPQLRVMLKILGNSAASFLPVFFLFAIITYIYCQAGMAFFRETPEFASTPVALKTLYILAIGDDWNLVMRRMQYHSGNFPLVRGFVVSYVFLVTLVIMNLLIVVLLKVFEQEFLRKSLSQKCLLMYKREWYKAIEQFRVELRESTFKQSMRNQCDVHGSNAIFHDLAIRLTNINYLPPEMFPVLLMKLKPPLGILDFNSGEFTSTEILKLIHMAKIPLTRGNLVNYNSALFSLSDFRYQVNTGEIIPDELKGLSLKLYLQRHRFMPSLCGFDAEEIWEYFEMMINESNPDYYLSHYLAASIIQTAFRLYKLQSSRERSILQTTVNKMGWTKPRQLELALVFNRDNKDDTSTVYDDEESEEENVINDVAIV